MTMILDGTAGATYPDASVQTKAALSSPQSMIRLSLANGYGSTNAVIRRFTNVHASQGTDITYADSATLGASFTINANGVYGISYSDQFSSSSTVGLSLNTTAPTTVIYSIPIAEILTTCANATANNSGCAAGTFYLPAGSVVRPHTSGATSGGTTALCQFTITRVA